MLDQPEPAYTLSTTLPPSDYSLSHPSSLAHSATDNDPIFASTPPSSSVSSTFLPSASPTLSRSRSHSLARVAADVPEISSTPLSSPTLAFSMPISSEFEYLPSATVDQPEPAPTLLSTPPSPSSISPTFLPSPARLATEDQPEPESASTLLITPSSPALLSGPSLPFPSTDNIFKIASTPHCSSEVPPTNFECPPSEMVDQPEFEPEHVSLSSITSTSSMPAPSLAPEYTDLELLSPPPTPLSTSLACSEYSTSLSSPTKPSPPESPTSLPAHSLPSLRPSPGEPCYNLGLEPFAASANLAPSPSTSILLLVLPVSSDFPPASASPSLVLGDLELEFSSTPVRAADIVPLSSPQPFESMSSLHEPFPILPAPLELMTVPISPHSTPPQRPPGVMLTGSASSVPEVTPSFASSIPRLGWKPSLVYEAPSTRLPTFTPRSLPSLRPSSASTRFNFALSLITVTVLVSTLLNISKTLSTFARKLWSKNQDTGNSQKSTPGYKTGDDLAHRLQLGQYTPRALRFVFDPGGQFSSSSVQVSSFGTRRRSPAQVEDTHRLPNNLIVFNPGIVAFVLEPAHEDSATLDEDAWRLHLHARRTLPFILTPQEV
ncbi:hypothetical protein EDB83DRAFT_2479287 [Lactarius deliciosus]|nr:hypothetical protein EDB83DRAFT_2479287 [Lactarius deliciosus]